MALREAIVRAELEPGRRLSENELADLLGVSRTPVREALARLRDDGLVAIVPQLGTFVTLISSAAVADAAFVRGALECAAIRLATDNATPRDLKELQANLAAQERAMHSDDTEAFGDASGSGSPVASKPSDRGRGRQEQPPSPGPAGHVGRPAGRLLPRNPPSCGSSEMSASIDYVDVARFDAIDRNEVVAAAFARPGCLGVPPCGRFQSAPHESDIELRCVSCDAGWTVVVDRGHLLRLVLAPPPDIVLSE